MEKYVVGNKEVRPMCPKRHKIKGMCPNGHLRPGLELRPGVDVLPKKALPAVFELARRPFPCSNQHPRGEGRETAKYEGEIRSCLLFLGFD